MDGTIKVKSTLGEGTEFCVELRTAFKRKADPSAVVAPPTESKIRSGMRKASSVVSSIIRKRKDKRSSLKQPALKGQIL